MLVARLPGRIAKAAALVAMFAAMLVAPAPAAAAGPIAAGWEPAGDTALSHGFAPVVALGDGTVITAGGTDGQSYTAAAERWSAGAWSAAGSIGQAAAGQVAALLPNGTALFAGGAGMTSYYTFGDLFDPVAGTWTQTPAMAHAHAYGVAAQLQNGDVMVIGGYDGGPTLITGAVDIYSASGGTWSAAAPLPEPRYAFTATRLGDGRVLVAGGDTGTLGAGAALSSVFIYDPGANTWTQADSMNRVRVDAAAVRLTDGRILVAGGTDASGAAQNTAELFDPATGHWALTGFMTSVRAGFTLSALPDGRLLAAGGFGSSPLQALDSTDLYDPTLGGWTASGKMSFGRRYQAVASLADGSVMAAGGHAYGAGYSATAEIYAPPPPKLTFPATTYHPVAPTRLLDTRSSIGLSGYFYSAAPRQFQVSGRDPIPGNAVAVTGNLTTTRSTTSGVLVIGPVFTAAPNFSTLNHAQADNRANNVTVGLDSNGMLSVVFLGDGKTHVLFDVTGYFTADDTGATFVPVTPSRLLDNRSGIGGITGRFVAGKDRTFQVTGRGGVPPEAVAVTGNFTLVKPTALSSAFIGPSAVLSTVKSSTINAPAGDTRANGTTVKLGRGGTLGVVFWGKAGSQADMLFDVAGYWVDGLSGAKFVPIEPARFVDTRVNMPFMGPVVVGTPANPQIAGRGGVPAQANGIAGNVTVTGQSLGGFLCIAPKFDPGESPTISTINFPKGDTRANGFDVSLGPGGSISVLHEVTAGATTHFMIDITGYFLPPPSP
jgi:hypothetical protein